ncbi:molybdenum cofactor biosynthesis protein C [Beutenbergia cavernae DSM 12333]|uniref:Cyclic pyranopterin monophosphate synthase n=1 Tax=Beutenbergia cavernae (strain ATCC BAA-8 / DSM 12333 / CCUG 43141 / JCM 11478 / NBRC 16432 / NCIMB 13614 / HKI 0122) TaxID=471853 RepID=C5C437_BEUC1|nr:bifunctional molybdenum cofactor biosynthesis protein MoaC/MoaB [Beutenbergia cavernae]ACQ79950.1 molybdenum cofactor biosynthesis protein C [Beutenbergia cavernae DSM 12333]
MPPDDSGLTHLDEQGRARMVDVGDKDVTDRVATAAGTVVTTARVVRAIAQGGRDLAKGDVVAVARLAGIGAAKRTWELVPLCHQIPLSGVDVDVRTDVADGADDDDVAHVHLTATARTRGRTGVEMEALTAVAVAGLTVHDMIKAVDPAAVLTDVRLVQKTGGRHGTWTRPDPSARGSVRDRERIFAAADASAAPARPLPRTARVLVVSTGVAVGTRADTTGPAIVDWLTERGFAAESDVTADADVAAALAGSLAPPGGSPPALVVTTGGTGVSPTDRTPEATAPLLARELPGLADAVRRAGADVPGAVLSRALAGVSAGGTVVVNLPGSPSGVTDGLAVLDGVLDHLLAQVAGGGAHE